MPKTRRQSEHVTHTADGVNYSIEIAPCGKGKFIGIWTCMACGLSGGSSSFFPSKDETLLHTKINLSTHTSSHKSRQPK